MKYLLLTDTHYGIKNNSMTWWRTQASFIRDQLIPYIKKNHNRHNLRIIMLGDVFDCRASVSVYIMHEVRRLITELAGYVDCIYIICGNHDLYTEQTSEYCSLLLTFGGTDSDNIHIVVDGYESFKEGNKDIILLPWHTQKQQSITDWTAQFVDEFESPVVFTHSDIIMGSPKLHCPVFSGHVHTPYINGNIRNLGSCYPQTFADNNANRYFYVWDPEDDRIERFANEKAIRFWRVRNEDVLTKDWDSLPDTDYVEVYVRCSLLMSHEYQDIIAHCKKKFRNFVCYPQPDELDDNIEVIDCDIDSIVEASIPDELRSAFEKVKQKRLELQ